MMDERTLLKCISSISFGGKKKKKEKKKKKKKEKKFFHISSWVVDSYTNCDSRKAVGEKARTE